LTVLAGLQNGMTNLEYLVGCWRRWHNERTRFGAPKQPDEETLKRMQALEFIKQKVLEGIGLQLQEPELFPQPSG
jgi:ubiquitin conjugation factor E4 B